MTPAQALSWVIHLCVKPLLNLWLRTSDTSWQRLPQPAEQAVVHSSGFNPDRVLLLGGTIAVGYGVVSHDLALAGQLSRQLSSRTFRGADVEVHVARHATVLSVSAAVADLDLSRCDAALLVVGSREALELLPESEFRRQVRSLVVTVSATPADIFLLDVLAVRGNLGLPRSYVAAARRRSRAFSHIIRQECSRAGVGFIPVAALDEEIVGASGKEAYEQWAGMIAPDMVGALDERANLQVGEREIDLDDTARVTALRDLGLDDSLALPALDQIVEKARNLFGIDTAAFNLVDSDHQWTKAFAGRTLPSLPRADGLCGITINRSGAFVVEDLTKDPRFSAFDWVGGEQGARFYAGYPIETTDGHRIGTLCLLDSQPRIFTPSDQALLRQLALQLQGALSRVRR